MKWRWNSVDYLEESEILAHKLRSINSHLPKSIEVLGQRSGDSSLLLSKLMLMLIYQWSVIFMIGSRLIIIQSNCWLKITSKVEIGWLSFIWLSIFCSFLLRHRVCKPENGYSLSCFLCLVNQSTSYDCGTLVFVHKFSALVYVFKVWPEVLKRRRQR